MEPIHNKLKKIVKAMSNSYDMCLIPNTVKSNKDLSPNFNWINKSKEFVQLVFVILNKLH